MIQKPLKTESTGGDRETILLVEDEDVVRRSVSMILSFQSYRVLTASGGEEALSIAEEAGDAFDLVITDVLMPGMTGPQLARTLRERRPDLSVLFMSGYADDAVDEPGPWRDRLAFIQKPFAIDELLGRVRSILDRAG